MLLVTDGMERKANVYSSLVKDNPVSMDLLRKTWLRRRLNYGYNYVGGVSSNMHKARGFSLQCNIKLSMVVHTCNPGSWDIDRRIRSSKPLLST